MIRIVVIFAIIAVLAVIVVWFAERPGALQISWLGYEIETSLMLAVGAGVLLALALAVAISILRGVLGMPGAISGYFRSRRQMHGLEALSKGVVAAGAGDAAGAARYSAQANKVLGNQPLAQLLKAQAAQLSGDTATVIRVFDAMLQDPETEALGLRGLFVQAHQEGDFEAARRYAERAFALSPHLTWAARAVLSIQSSEGDWAAAEATLDLCRRNKLMDADEATRKKAVVTTARAMALEEASPDKALELALDAHKAAPDLVPAAAVAGRVLAATGQTRKAGKVLEKTWRLSPHPEIAELYAAAKTGAAPRERLKRVRALVTKAPDSTEGPIAVARAAVAAHEWTQARTALEPLLASRPTARVCSLMAEIEEGETGDEGRTREWLARAVTAPADPVWTADGYTSEAWRPYSPTTGELDAFRWKVPVEGLRYRADAATPARDGAKQLADKAGQPDDPGPETEEETKAEAKAGKPAKPDTGTQTPEAPAKAKQKDGKIAAEKPTVFVAPHAPDDPGPEPRDEATENPY